MGLIFMQRFRNCLRLSSLGAVLLLGGCAALHLKPPPKAVVVVHPTPTPKPVPKKPGSYWDGDGVSGAPSIVISLGDQRAYFYKGDKLVGVSAISSGKKGFDTPLGEFKVIQKDQNHESNLYGDYLSATGEMVKHNVDVTKDPTPEGAVFKGAKMPFFMRFHDGAGMHAGHLPGHRASHGCVRMPKFMAERFFKNVEIGTPVTVNE